MREKTKENILIAIGVSAVGMMIVLIPFIAGMTSVLVPWLCDQGIRFGKWIAGL